MYPRFPSTRSSGSKKGERGPSTPATSSTPRASATRRSTCSRGARRLRRAQARQGDVDRRGRRRHVPRRHRDLHGRADAGRVRRGGAECETIAFDRPALRAMLAASPELGEIVLTCMLARRAWHEEAGHGVLRLIAERGSRRAFDVRDLLERNLLPVQFLRRRHRPAGDDVPRLARHPARGDADPGQRRPRAAQPVGGAGGARPRAARRRRRPALRPRRARRRPGGAGGGGLRRLRGPAHVRRPRPGRRAGRRAPARASRTTSASPPASPAPS